MIRVFKIFCLILCLTLLWCTLLRIDSFAQAGSTRPQPPPNSDKSPSEQSDQAKQAPQEPIEKADQLKSKLTFGLYFLPGSRNYDLNYRRQFGSLTSWVAAFINPHGTKLMRVGAQYDYKYQWLHLVPTLEVSTTKAMAGSLYSEMGGRTYAIAGVSRTNLKPFFDLFWDPGDSVQLGFGHKISDYDRVTAYSIFDVRLHTHQQNTHISWRHRLNAANGITLDALIKTGRGDEGYTRAAGLGIYYDRPTWFWKLYYDPHVNFTNQTMVRTGIGYKF